MNKRRWLMGSVAALAGLAGGGLAWWRLQLRAAEDSAMQALWQMHWNGPQGQSVSMQAFQGRPLVLNFWATWCPPCVKELPLLNAFYQEHKAQGWQVLGLAIDKADAVQRFLAHMPLDFPVAVAGVPGADLGKQLGNVSGGLPFTVVFDAEGSVRYRKLGQLAPEDLAQWGAR